MCYFHFESLGLRCEMTVMPLEWVLGHDTLHLHILIISYIFNIYIIGILSRNFKRILFSRKILLLLDIFLEFLIIGLWAEFLLYLTNIVQHFNFLCQIFFFIFLHYQISKRESCIIIKACTQPCGYYPL